MGTDDVRYWLRVKQPSREVYVPDLTPRSDLAHLLGAYLGDGRTAGEQDKKVRFKVADPDFAEMLNRLVAKVLRAKVKRVTMERGFLCVNYDSAVLYDYLQQSLTDLLPLVVSFPSMFLRGFFDAEGFVSPMLNHSTQRFLGIMLGVSNTNLEYLNCVQRLLEGLGMNASSYKTHEVGEPMTIRGRTFIRKHEVHQLRLQGGEVAREFQAAIDFSVPAKKQKLADLVWISENLRKKDGYWRFRSFYERRNRRWIRMNQRHISSY